MNTSTPPVSHARLPEPSAEWPIHLRFAGREEGAEEIRCRTRRGVVVALSAPLGTFVHALTIGESPHGLPSYLWPKPPPHQHFAELLDELFAERGYQDPPERLLSRFPPAVIFSQVPWGRIHRRVGLVTEGFDVAEYHRLLRKRQKVLRAFRRLQKRQKALRAIQSAGRDRRQQRLRRQRRRLRAVRGPITYWTQHTRLVDIWCCQDVIAAAWAEILHSIQNRATARRCGICDVLFLRPRTYPRKLCITCGSLNWRQQARMAEVHPAVRLNVALQIAKANRRGRPFQDWERWKWPEIPSVMETERR